MESGSPSGRSERLVLDMGTANRLAQAGRRVGGVEVLARVWSPWRGFVRGALGGVFALCEVELRGLELDLARLLALGPAPRPSRPDLGLRWGVGVTLALRRLEAWPLARPLTPGLVTRIVEEIDAPQFSRGLRRGGGEGEPVAGASVWTLAPRWAAQGLNPLWAAGLALALWEREGPDHQRRSVAGRVLLYGLLPRLGIPGAALVFLGPSLVRAAASLPGGWDGLVKQVRNEGAWRRFVVVFLAALEASARRVVELVEAAQVMHADHRGLIETWVRAPRHPMRLLELLLRRPVVDLPAVAGELEVTQRTAGLLVKKLSELNLLREITGQRRGRKFAYAPLLGLLQPGWGEEEPREEGAPPVNQPANGGR